MTNQDCKDEWLIKDEANMRFHFKQYDIPYRSTIAFEKFLSNQVAIKRRSMHILDICAGGEDRIGT